MDFIIIIIVIIIIIIAQLNCHEKSLNMIKMY